MRHLCDRETQELLGEKWTGQFKSHRLVERGTWLLLDGVLVMHPDDANELIGLIELYNIEPAGTA